MTLTPRGLQHRLADSRPADGHQADPATIEQIGEPLDAGARAGAFVKRTARAMRIVMGHRGIPRPIRWLAALGLLPIPGPFDEALLLVVGLILFGFYRPALRQAWREADS